LGLEQLAEKDMAVGGLEGEAGDANLKIGEGDSLLLQQVAEAGYSWEEEEEEMEVMEMEVMEEAKVDVVVVMEV